MSAGGVLEIVAAMINGNPLPYMSTAPKEMDKAMTAKSVRFERLKTGNNYSHEKIGVELEPMPGESARNALERAIKFVDAELHDRDMPF